MTHRSQATGFLRRRFQIRSILLTIAVAALLGPAGCVTPAAVKEASTKHKTNLVSLHGAVGAYRKNLGAYYDRLSRLQRDAYVSHHMTQFIHEMATKQADSLKRLNADSAKDFIAAGAEMAGGFEFWAANFDLWMKQDGDTLDKKRAALRGRAEELEAGGQAEAAAKLRAQADRDDGDLTYLWVAVELQQQEKLLDAQLNLLAAQVETMQECHAKIDEFLSVDATIDGGKIAEAAAAGSNVDVSGLLGGRGG